MGKWPRAKREINRSTSKLAICASQSYDQRLNSQLQLPNFTNTKTKLLDGRSVNVWESQIASVVTLAEQPTPRNGYTNVTSWPTCWGRLWQNVGKPHLSHTLHPSWYSIPELGANNAYHTVLLPALRCMIYVISYPIVNFNDSLMSKNIRWHQTILNGTKWYQLMSNLSLKSSISPCLCLSPVFLSWSFGGGNFGPAE